MPGPGEANAAETPTGFGAAVQSSADPDQLVREVIQNEIQAQISQRDLWSYRELTRSKGKELLLEYCETKYGSIHRLLAVNGHPLDAKQRQVEDRRIQELIASPGALHEAQKKERADAEEERKFLSLIPKAFRYQVQRRDGDLATLRFTPNRDFEPSGLEAHALAALEGTMVLNVKEKRLVSIRGQLMREVKFWGGLLGHLDQGGTFSVVSENVAPGDWELKSLNIEMNGRALFFKTIAVHEQKSYSNYSPVPPDSTLTQAAERLQKDSRGQTCPGLVVQASCPLSLAPKYRLEGYTTTKTGGHQ